MLTLLLEMNSHFIELYAAWNIKAIFTVIIYVKCKCSGVLQQRRTSLPFPSTESNQDEDPFKFPRTQPVLNFGNICPGDAPLPIRPYHAIIEGSDK